MRHTTLFLLPLFLACAAHAQGPQPPLPPNYTALRGQDYVGEGNGRQMLDLYLPTEGEGGPRPVVIYIHGGGWENGSKENVTVLLNLIRGAGYAGVSLNYRLSAEAVWPAQIHDCKAAVRWLRGHAKEHNLDPGKIAVFGISAGGHLASMLGVTGGDVLLEGRLGKHLGESSKVNCVIDFCGPSNFLTFGGKGSNINPDDPTSALAKLLGGPVKEKVELSRTASPVLHVTPDDVPFLIIHGTRDNIVPYAQSMELDAALGAVKVPSTLLSGTDGGHVFFSLPLIAHMRTFLEQHLSGKEVTVPEGPVPVR